MERSKKKKIRYQTIRRSERLKSASTKKVEALRQNGSFVSRSNTNFHKYSDRLMPILSPSRKLQLSHQITSPNSSDDNDYHRRLSLAAGLRSLPLVLSYSTPINSPSMHYRPLRDLNNLNPSSLLKLSPKKPQGLRKFTSPDRVLDAPGLASDRFTSTIDCSKIGVVAVALKNLVYLWKEKNDETKLLYETYDSDCFTCLRFSKSGKKLGISTHSGKIVIFYLDVCGFNETQSFSSHVLSLENVMIEFEGDNLIWTGAFDGSLAVLTIEDGRHRIALSEKLALLSTPHSSPITKICSSPEYVAIGESGGLVSLWRGKTLIRLISHPGPVVDLSWSVSFPDILAIAGGKTVNFYSVFQGKVTGQINTENEICRILWSTNTSEIAISTDSPEEHLSLCSYPEIKIQNCWAAHDCSPIFLGLTKCGTSLISAASDEFIKVNSLFY